MTTQQARKQKTILCVDDDANMLKAECRMLRGLPYRVLAASSGDEAIRVACEKKPDLILCDVMMPGMDGYEVLMRLREVGLTETPVVMLTAKGASASLLKGYEAGAVCYITKPFRNEQVLNVVEYLIGDLSPEARERLERIL